MSVLVVGPTCSGKSTLIQSDRINHLIFPLQPATNLIYGYETDRRKIPSNAYIHYNLLHGIPDESKAHGIAYWLRRDKVLKKILSVKISLAVVLVTPKDELIQRASYRQYIEKETGDDPYDRDRWIKAIEETNLPAVYEYFLALLEEHSIPYRVILSSSSTPRHFSITDRVFIPAHLRGQLFPMPSLADIEKILEQPGCQYQSVLLPNGVVTDKGANTHIRHGRYETFDMVLNENIFKESVLDIGCALGDLLYRAERLGAERLVGIEQQPDRFHAAVSISSMLNSAAEILPIDFMDYDEAELFDHVFMLNVIHHVHEFDSFIQKAVRVTRKTLVIEFPTLTDGKFSKNNGYWLPGLFNKLPLIGVSESAVDQTYVFSPKAIERIVKEIGGFDKVSNMKSPLKNRRILIFER